MTRLLGTERVLALSAGEVPVGMLVALCDVEAPITDVPVVRFAAERRSPRELLIAPLGLDLWRAGPRPAADELFDMPAPPSGAPVLLVGRQTADVATTLRDRDVPALVCSELTAAMLAQAGVVAFTDADVFPDDVFAVAAAGRLGLLAWRGQLFGLEDGVDCFRAEHPDKAAMLAEAAFRVPEAFAPVGRLARVAAEAHRASHVYARLAVDLEAGLGRVGDARNDRSASST